MYDGYDPMTSNLAGIPRATLVQWLSDAQAAYQEMSTGRRLISGSYTQGDGSKSTTFQMASPATLVARIEELKLALGISRRAPARFCF